MRQKIERSGLAPRTSGARHFFPTIGAAESPHSADGAGAQSVPPGQAAADQDSPGQDRRGYRPAGTTFPHGHRSG